MLSSEKQVVDGSGTAPLQSWCANFYLTEPYLIDVQYNTKSKNQIASQNKVSQLGRDASAAAILATGLE
jgi:hypothetical protein